MRILGLALLVGLAGCAPFHKGDTTHYVVIGFGVVSVPRTNTSPVQVVKSQAIGLSVSDQPGIKFGIGYSSSTTVSIHTNQNVLIEVSDRPLAPLKVESK
jgi:hypothetical protein